MADDWLMSYDRLRQQGTMAQPDQATLTADYHPGWWWGTTPTERTSGQAEPVPFGSLADPVSQAAFFLAPSMLAGLRSGLAGPVPGGLPVRWGGGDWLSSQRGNLGPPPQNVAGEVLPESVMRDASGQLERYYHGTGRVYPDFDLSHAGTGAGGDLYGPGIYMTNNPAVASGYTPVDRLAHLEQILPEAEARLALVTDATWKPTFQRTVDTLRQEIETLRPNLRPVYPDLKRPFDMNATIDAEEVQRLLYPKAVEKMAQTLAHPDFQSPAMQAMVRRLQLPEPMQGEELYQRLVERAGKAGANLLLQRQGYDGITHIGGGVTGGQAHKVAIAFSPENVYPSFTVDMLRPEGPR